MLLLMDGLFRLDVVISEDTIRTVVRNLSAGELTLGEPGDRGRPVGIGFGEAPAYRPSSSRIQFSLRKGDDLASVDMLLGLLRFDERGTVRVTAQATIRSG
jgi:hypothetical protein